MNDGAVYLFVGTGSSMVLEPLADALTASGRTVELFDTARDDAAAVVERLMGRKVVLITSDHVFLTSPTTGPTGSADHHVPSVAELIHRLRPVRTACYPHDLVCLFEPQDHLWLSLFDVVLVPDSRLGFEHRAGATVEVGWARKSAAIDRPPRGGAAPRRVIHFLSGLVRYFEDFGLERYLDIWGPLYACGVAVKAPPWPSTSAFEQAMQARGYSIIPAAANHYQVAAEFDVLITNGGSSVTAELALSGREVWHVVDEHLSSAALQLEVLQGFPNVRHLSLDDCRTALLAQARREPAPAHPDLLAPFDLDQAMAAVVVD